MAFAYLQSLLQQSSATGTRSTALSDLRWFAGILLTTLLVALRENAPTWILVTLAAFMGVAGAIYLGVYIFFAIKNPDALRSEKYNVSKMAIERSITGDNLVGFSAVESTPKALTVPEVPPRKEGTQ